MFDEQLRYVVFGRNIITRQIAAFSARNDLSAGEVTFDSVTQTSRLFSPPLKNTVARVIVKNQSRDSAICSSG